MSFSGWCCQYWTGVDDVASLGGRNVMGSHHSPAWNDNQQHVRTQVGLQDRVRHESLHWRSRVDIAGWPECRLLIKETRFPEDIKLGCSAFTKWKHCSFSQMDEFLLWTAWFRSAPTTVMHTLQQGNQRCVWKSPLTHARQSLQSCPIKTQLQEVCVCVCFVWEESSVAALWGLLNKYSHCRAPLEGLIDVQAPPSSCLYSSLRPVPPSSPCWLGPSVAPAWIAARPRSSCHCCAACAVRPPAWWGAARPEIRPGPLLCTLPGPPTGWAGEESDSRAPGAKCKTEMNFVFFAFANSYKGLFIMDANVWSFLIMQMWFHLKVEGWGVLKAPKLVSEVRCLHQEENKLKAQFSFTTTLPNLLEETHPEWDGPRGFLWGVFV